MYVIIYYINRNSTLFYDHIQSAHTSVHCMLPKPPKIPASEPRLSAFPGQMFGSPKEDQVYQPSWQHWKSPPKASKMPVTRSYRV